jgi:hypothetical protein
MRKLLTIFFLAAALPVLADPPATEPLPSPDLPQIGPAGEELEPEVKIIKKENATIEEYRMNGVLYMVKIVPGTGLPYYLIDTDGDGYLESKLNNLDQGIMVPQWMIYRW